VRVCGGAGRIVVLCARRPAPVITPPCPPKDRRCALIGRPTFKAAHRFCATVCGVFFKVAKDRVAAELQLVIGFWWDSNTLTRTLEERKVLSYLATLADYAARPTLNLKEMQQVAGRMGRCVATFPPGARCLLCAVFALMVGLRLPWHRRHPGPTTVRRRRRQVGGRRRPSPLARRAAACTRVSVACCTVVSARVPFFRMCVSLTPSPYTLDASQELPASR
jgi:hypothetical protein